MEPNDFQIWSLWGTLRENANYRMMLVLSGLLPTRVTAVQVIHKSCFKRSFSTEASQESKQEVVSIKVPQMGESIKEVIAQIETDKVTVEVRAPESGTIVEELVKGGDTVAVGAEIARLKPGAVSEEVASEPTETHSAAGQSSPVPIKVPEMGESIKEGTLVSWSKAEGDFVDMDEVIAQVETDKVTVEIRAPQMGVLQKRVAKEGDSVKVGSDIAILQPSSAPTQQQASKDTSTATSPRRSGGEVSSSSSSSSQKAESSDLKQQPEKQSISTSTLSPPKPPKQVADYSKLSSVESQEGAKRVAMTRMRRRIAERLKQAQNTAAMLTTFNEVDMSALMELRNNYKEAFEKKHGIRLGFMSAFTKAATLALMEQPELNAYIDGSDIVYHDYVDISVAVSAPTGLVVPVIRNCQRLSFAEIEKAIHTMGEQARLGKLTIQDMQGGTFTISNGGVFGSLLSTPILNMPQSAILGMHTIQKRPVVVNDQIVIRPMMYLALSYDHRLVDGREAVTFLRRIKSLVEDPRKILLDIDI
ncbi:Dihydrolipoyllysine-residue succinyltransferase component of 2-oxoglutarate dehydrogenase complex, mitochondrial [Galdieria sulphuraria]|nr:Dihydrolipoyllysine-residue succinyltransferase component of 2-oxoglutarate dehydrogenase complex, mitochondrial [Galdieria sulphuraria]